MCMLRFNWKELLAVIQKSLKVKVRLAFGGIVNNTTDKIIQFFIDKHIISNFYSLISVLSHRIDGYRMI